MRHRARSAKPIGNEVARFGIFAGYVWHVDLMQQSRLKSTIETPAGLAENGTFAEGESCRGKNLVHKGDRAVMTTRVDECAVMHFKAPVVAILRFVCSSNATELGLICYPDSVAFDYEIERIA